MSRHRKTRQQKMHADLNRNSQKVSSLTNSGLPIFSFEIPSVVSEEKQKTAILQSLLVDLRKTFILTILIILAEIFLFYLLRSHKVALPVITALY